MFEPGIPCVTDCVMAELEKLGHRYRVALRSVDNALSLLVTGADLAYAPVLPETPDLSVYIVLILALTRMTVLSNV